MSGIVTDRPELRANDLVVAKEMADTLHTAYPGHLWAVSVDNGVAIVRNLNFAGNWGFRLYVEQAWSGSEFKKRVLRAGGEILERFRMARSRLDWDKYAELPVNFAGRHTPEL